MCFFASADQDCVILRVQLGTDWVVDRGSMSMQVDRTKRRKMSSPKNSSKPPIDDGATFLKLAALSYTVVPTQRVVVFGFPAAQPGPVVTPASVSRVLRGQFALNTLSAPGGSGSAIIATRDGLVLGYVGGALDSDHNNTQYQMYAFKLDSLPKRLSSASTSPTLKAVASPSHS